MTKNLLSLEWISQLNHFSKLIVGFSGGLDSTVLLHSLAREGSLRFKLVAVHINHGISQNSLNWLEHCQQFCSNLGINFLSHNLEIKHRANLEDTARRARYAFFSTLMHEQSCLILGHHLDDQAETLLLQLFRGSGINGLAGMSQVAQMISGTMIRPLLSYSRKQLEDYARIHQLKWVEDESNLDSHYARNFLRHEVIPLLKNKWPKVVNNIANTANHCQEARVNLDELAALDSLSCLITKSRLDIEGLKNLSFARISNVLRLWLRNNKIQMPSSSTFHRIIHEVLFAKSDARPIVSWQDVQIKRYQRTLYLERKEIKTPLSCVNWSTFPNTLIINDKNLYIKARKAMHGLIIPKDAFIQIRFRQGGECFVLNGQTKTLKKLMQDWKIPPWERSNIPLIYINNQIVAVIGYAISDLSFTKNPSIAWDLSFELFD